jgi:hypothetical protein
VVVSQVVKICPFPRTRGEDCYLILDCGHWYHWTRKSSPDMREMDCPACQMHEALKREERRQ